MIEFFEMLNDLSPLRTLAYLIFILFIGNIVFSFMENVLTSFFSIFKNEDEIYFTEAKNEEKSE
jgi:hypothetical protein